MDLWNLLRQRHRVLNGGEYGVLASREPVRKRV